MTPDLLLSLLRGLAAGATLAELRSATGLSRPSIHRLLRELEGLGLRVETARGRPVRVLDWGIIDPARIPAAGRISAPKMAPMVG